MTPTSRLETQLLRRIWWLTAASIGRHPLVLVLTTVLGLGAGFGALKVYPRSYRASCRLLAQRNLVMPALGNPHRSVPLDSDQPTRAVADTILTRENLVKMVKQTGLMERWEADRPPLLRLKDALVRRLRKPPTEAQRLEALVGVLEKRLTVSTDDTSLTVAFIWPNPITAAAVVQQAEDNFLATRHATEVSTISEAIHILEGHAADVRATIDSTYAQFVASVGAGASGGDGSDSNFVKAARALDRLQAESLPTRKGVALSRAERAREAERREDVSDEAETNSPDEPKTKAEYPKARLKVAFDNYDELQRRIDAARIELDTAEAAFKYRYLVIEPVRVPERPVAPHAAILLAGGGLAGLLIGLALAFGRDLRGERIESAWQVEQAFRIPVLVEVREE